MRFFYTALWYLILPALFLRLWLHGRLSPAYRRRWQERLARGYQHRLAGCVWIHAVSVGETLAAAPMIEALLRRYPATPLLVTTTTPTGSEQLRRLFGERVHHVYWPWDVPTVLRRFFRQFQPQLVILLETELWPNLVAQAGARAIPVVLVNGRLSQRSHRGYRLFRRLTAPMLEQFAALAVQTAEEAERFVDLGADAERVQVAGNLKFDVSLDQQVRQQAETLRGRIAGRPVWIAASTHPGEDAIVLAAHQQIRQHHADALLVLVPRHQERFEEVAVDVIGSGLSLARRSRGELPGDVAVYLGDSMGELLMLYGLADVAFVGGSLVSVGGHNLLEPALWQLPIITGPVLHNFTRVAALLDEAGAHRVVTTTSELAEEVLQLFTAVGLRQQMGARAAAVVAGHRGALQRHLEMLAPLWPPTPDAGSAAKDSAQ